MHWFSHAAYTCAEDDPAYARVLERLNLSPSAVPQPQSQPQLGAAATQPASDADDCGDSLPELTHPRSRWLRSSLQDPQEDFKAVARVGDISHGVSADDDYAGQTHAHAALARLCKTHIELDRSEAMREVCACFCTAVTADFMCTCRINICMTVAGCAAGFATAIDACPKGARRGLHADAKLSLDAAGTMPAERA